MMGKVCSMCSQGKSAYKIFVIKPEQKRPLGRPEHRWGYKMNLETRVGGFGLDSSGSGQGPVADSCVHSNEFSGPIKGRTFLQ
jgi:hypothetical protein